MLRVMCLDAVQPRSHQESYLVIAQPSAGRMRGDRHAAGAVNPLDRFCWRDLHALYITATIVPDELLRERCLHGRHHARFHHRPSDMRPPDVFTTGDCLHARPRYRVAEFIQPLDHEVCTAESPRPDG